MRRLLALVLLFCGAATASPSRAAETRHDGVVNGVRLTWWTSRPIRHGDVPVLFLHGGPGYNSYSFRMTAGQALDARYPMVYLDERGSGASERPWNGDYALPTLVQDIEALRQRLGVARMVVAGHSFGGTLAAEYAQAHPDRVARLILIDAAVDLPGAMEAWVQTLATDFPKAYAVAERSDAGKALRAVPAGERCALSHARMAFVGVAKGTMSDSQVFHDRQQFHVQAAKDEQERLDRQSGLRNTGEIGAALFAPPADFLCYTVAHPERLRMPTLVLVGAHDRAVGVAPQRALASRLPQATLVVFPDSAHFAYQEEPSAFLRAVERFLDGSGSSPRNTSAP